jgi:hypothetical protein
MRVTRNYGSHDPMNARVPGAHWYGADDLMPLPKPALEMIEHEPVAPELVAPELQHNDHVMAYWNWRLDRMARRT